MTSVLRRVFHGAVSLSAVAALTKLGIPAVVSVAGLAVLMLAAACWVLGSGDRSDRLARIILGIRGNARCLDRTDADTSPPVAQGAPELVPNLPRTVAIRGTPRGRRRKNRRAGSHRRAVVSDA